VPAHDGLRADWAKQLSQLELRARKKALKKNGGDRQQGPHVGAPSYSVGDIGPTPSAKSLGEEATLQLAIGYLLRILADQQLTHVAWRDTSASGVTDTTERPDFSSFKCLPQMWSTLVSFCFTFACCLHCCAVRYPVPELITR